MNRRCRRIPSAIIELLEDRLENSSDQLQPLKDHNILKTQQNIWVTAQGTEQHCDQTKRVLGEVRF